MRERIGGLDVLVHCVGINDRKPIEAYTAQEWDRIVGVNLTSAFHLGAQAAAAMREQGRGRIVFFSSVAGRSGHKLHGPYAATKGAINQLMRVIAHEYAAHGVTVNAVAPGYMDTELTRKYLTEHPDKRQALIELIPAGPARGRRSRAVSVLTPCELYHGPGALHRWRTHDCLGDRERWSSDSAARRSWSPAPAPASAPRSRFAREALRTALIDVGGQLPQRQPRRRAKR